MASCDYLLRFEPLFRRYLWGGRRLGSVLHKPIGPGDDFAESWEIVDRGADQSVVQNGALAGKTLGELVAQHGRELLGRHADRYSRFPLLLKLLDCNLTLSVQVHPNDAQAARLDPPDLGKTEAWVVLAADPGSKIYAGLKEGVTREALAVATAAGRCDQCMNVIEPRVGDCVFIPAGTVHALGAGLMIAEIQQASDTTYRLFDWNRVGADGKPRPLHIEESLAVTDFDRGPVEPQTPQPTGEAGRERLVACDKFFMERVTVDSPRKLGGDGVCHVLIVVAGEASAGDNRLKTGDSALLPAAAAALELQPIPQAVLLDIRLPD